MKKLAALAAAALVTVTAGLGSGFALGKDNEINHGLAHRVAALEQEVAELEARVATLEAGSGGGGGGGGGGEPPSPPVSGLVIDQQVSSGAVNGGSFNPVDNAPRRHDPSLVGHEVGIRV